MWKILSKCLPLFGASLFWRLSVSSLCLLASFLCTVPVFCAASLVCIVSFLRSVSISSQLARLLIDKMFPVLILNHIKSEIFTGIKQWTFWLLRFLSLIDKNSFFNLAKVKQTKNKHFISNRYLYVCHFVVILFFWFCKSSVFLFGILLLWFLIDIENYH